MSNVTIEISDHIARVQLNRPDKRNAVDQQMFDDLISAGAQVAASEARVAILSGAGESFCAGIDIGSLGAMIGEDIKAMIMARTHGEGTTNKWQEAALVWHRLDIPVIAALQGAVYGAGLQIALGADIRIAAPDTKLAVMEMKWGIIPDMGGMVLLPRLVRSDVMRRLIYTATPVDAAQGERWGLVTEIAEDPMAAAEKLASEIAGKSPKAIRAAKSLVGIAEREPPDALLLAESRLQAELLGKPEQMEVVAAQFGKRAPVFD
ncbi:crotonase/enoyl-CoA hydratase family protein [uncultured Roseobacter sp.]|uniref:crotonase/enoyl-CoA hydratase family protein n=1 Tax=uncultured Roseobacter sp. TaxID=114847 RepID=UPI002615CBCE|nr:crotonase/enoyl-CoA hydratase family protein [uncultured Roseobacter sp.]